MPVIPSGPAAGPYVSRATGPYKPSRSKGSARRSLRDSRSPSRPSETTSYWGVKGVAARARQVDQWRRKGAGVLQASLVDLGFLPLSAVTGGKIGPMTNSAVESYIRYGRSRADNWSRWATKRFKIKPAIGPAPTITDISKASRIPQSTLEDRYSDVNDQTVDRLTTDPNVEPGTPGPSILGGLEPLALPGMGDFDPAALAPILVDLEYGGPLAALTRDVKQARRQREQNLADIGSWYGQVERLGADVAAKNVAAAQGTIADVGAATKLSASLFGDEGTPTDAANAAALLADAEAAARDQGAFDSRMGAMLSSQKADALRAEGNRQDALIADLLGQRRDLVRERGRALTSTRLGLDKELYGRKQQDFQNILALRQAQIAERMLPLQAAQAEANINATLANTAATQQATDFAAQQLPYQLQALQQQLEQQALELDAQGPWESVRNNPGTLAQVVPGIVSSAKLPAPMKTKTWGVDAVNAATQAIDYLFRDIDPVSKQQLLDNVMTQVYRGTPFVWQGGRALVKSGWKWDEKKKQWRKWDGKKFSD